MTISSVNNKCATLRHGGRFGGSLAGGNRGTSPSPNLKNVSQPTVKERPKPQIMMEEERVRIEDKERLIEDNLMKGNLLPKKSSISTVSKDYSKNQSNYPSSTLPYKKPGSGFTETSSTTSILKKEMENKMQSSVYSIDTSYHMNASNTNNKVMNQRQELFTPIGATTISTPSSTASAATVISISNASHHPPPAPPPLITKTSNISILNQPLPEIPHSVSVAPPPPILPSSMKQSTRSKNNQQPLCAATLNNYRSLQRPSNKSSLSTMQQNPTQQLNNLNMMPMKEKKPALPTKQTPPQLPPKNRYKDDYGHTTNNINNNNNINKFSSRPQQPLPMPPNNSSSKTQQQQQFNESLLKAISSGINNLNNNNNNSSNKQQHTHSSFGYEKTNLASNTLDYRTKTTSSSSQHENNRNINNNRYSSNAEHHEPQPSYKLSKSEMKQQNLQSYQTLPKNHHHHHHHHPNNTSSFSNIPQQQPQQQHQQPQQQHHKNNTNSKRGHSNSGENDFSTDSHTASNSNKRDQPNVYYRSLQRNSRGNSGGSGSGNGGTTAQAHNDLYSVTEL